MEAETVVTDFIEDFNRLGTVSADSKISAYNELLRKILTTSEQERAESNLTAYLLSLIGGDVPIAGVSQSSEPLSIISLRPLLDTFITQFQGSSVNTETKISVAQTAVHLLRPRVASFAEQDTRLKELLADAYEAQEDYTSSARALQSIDLDSSQRTVTDTDRAQVWVRIARCYLEEDDPTAASAYINRVKNVVHNVSDKTTRLQFRMSQARILDSQRHFLDASAAYHNISFESLVDEDDRLQTLSAAIVCAVLAPAGPQRARTLARLYKDDRAAQIDEYAILEKIFLDRVLTPEEVASFAAKLQPHQLAKTSDGTTVLDRAVLEHNLLGASRLYRNIAIDNLGALLGVGGERAEQYAAQMIEQGRMTGQIDQVDRMIFFEGEGSGERLKGSGQSSSTRSSELRWWDGAVQGLAEEVEKISTMIEATYPEFYATKMAL